MYDSKDPNIITTIESQNNKAVVLTFDDGPSRVLPKILDILKKEDVYAMFFWQTRLLYPTRPWKRVLDEGHVIGSHSINHPNMVQLSFEQQYRQLAQSKAKIEEITGTNVTYFRPPFGQYNDATIQAAKQLDLTPVMWRVASIDWELKNDPEQIITNVTNNLEDGAIILLHELEQTVQALPDLIKSIKQKGYTFKLL